jgi:nucleoid-associated protein YgaU
LAQDIGPLVIEHRFATKYSKEKSTVYKRKRVTLMPVIALAALSLMVALPTLSSTRLYAASATRYSTVTVHRGDTLWSIAAARTNDSGDVQEMIDRISDANHLGTSPIQAGQNLRVPK